MKIKQIVLLPFLIFSCTFPSIVLEETSIPSKDKKKETSQLVAIPNVSIDPSISPSINPTQNQLSTPKESEIKIDSRNSIFIKIFDVYGDSVKDANISVRILDNKKYNWKYKVSYLSGATYTLDNVPEDLPLEITVSKPNYKNKVMVITYPKNSFYYEISFLNETALEYEIKPHFSDTTGIWELINQKNPNLKKIIGLCQINNKVFLSEGSKTSDINNPLNWIPKQSDFNLNGFNTDGQIRAWFGGYGLPTIKEWAYGFGFTLFVSDEIMPNVVSFINDKDPRINLESSDYYTGKRITKTMKIKTVDSKIVNCSDFNEYFEISKN